VYGRRPHRLLGTRENLTIDVRRNLVGVERLILSRHRRTPLQVLRQRVAADLLDHVRAPAGGRWPSGARSGATAERQRLSAVSSATPVTVPISSRLRPLSSYSTNTSRCSGGSASSARLKSARN